MIVRPQEAEDSQIRKTTLSRHKEMGACGTSFKDMEACGNSPKKQIANQKQVIVKSEKAEDSHNRHKTSRRHKKCHPPGNALGRTNCNMVISLHVFRL